MRTLILNKFLHRNGGSETYIFKLGEALEQHGHEVQYFGMEHEGRCVGNRVNAYTSDMDFHGGSKLSKLTYPIKTIYSKEARVQLRKVLDDFKPDVCHVMGGWGIWETVNGEQQLTTEYIENVIMMMPFSAVVMWTFGEKIGNGWKKILWQSGKIAFIFSISIEMLQLLLRLGTFQLSDIFYNIVGGVLGGLLYCVAMKARKCL